MKYINPNTGHTYTGGAMTRKDNGVLWSGIPTEGQLAAWGYEPVKEQAPSEPTEQEQRERRMAEIQEELQGMDYLTSKYIDGEDMTEYGDWQGKRKALREEYRRLEAQ